MGVNAIRIWGGGFPEKDWLYDICDDLGILIWQDFPLSSSGLDNYPPDGAKEIYEITEIARHYVTRLEHHPSLMLWCGGNELYQKGFSYMFGLTTGYQFQIGNRWNMDIFLGIGSQQGFYKGYVEYLPETQENRYDRVENWDKSGEIIPFKGGVMISYKL